MVVEARPRRIPWCHSPSAYTLAIRNGTTYVRTTAGSCARCAVPTLDKMCLLPPHRTRTSFCGGVSGISWHTLTPNCKPPHGLRIKCTPKSILRDNRRRAGLAAKPACHPRGPWIPRCTRPVTCRARTADPHHDSWRGGEPAPWPSILGVRLHAPRATGNAKTAHQSSTAARTRRRSDDGVMGAAGSRVRLWGGTRPHWRIRHSRHTATAYVCGGMQLDTA